ncbi:MAG: GIY-YIG nuclease family protein [Patescibacteria group bacterium]
MVYWVYILRSIKDKKLYVGCTNNLDSRLKRHSAGFVDATKHRRPLTLIHSEIFQDRIMAFNRERFLKSLWGAREKKKILKNFLADNKCAAKSIRKAN